LHARELLGEAGCTPGDWHWIDRGDAADIAFDRDCEAARKALNSLRAPVDWVAQPAADREKRLFVADMDSTMIGQECIDELADFAGVKSQVALVTERAMRGEIDFSAALDARVALLKGLDVGAITSCLAERIFDTPGAATLVHTMRSRGAMTVLVSGGFTRFAGPVGQRIGFNAVHANVLEIDGDRLAGSVARPVVDADAKRNTLVQACAKLGLRPEQTLAIGDGANDVAMIRAAGLGIAYRAKPALVEAADASVDHNDLTALLWAQGIARCDWAKT